MARLTVFIDTENRVCSYYINSDGSVTVFGPDNHIETVNISGETCENAVRRALIKIVIRMSDRRKRIDSEEIRKYIEILEEERRKKTALASSSIPQP